MTNVASQFKQLAINYGEMVYPSSYETDEDTLRAKQPLYYFHPDHLGSSTLLTDNNGNPYQFFLNLPFGETMTEQKASGTYTNPYRFNGKELDEETGLYYYGARYYNPRYSVWLGVDPMVEKYSSISPYAFCLGNPIIFIDPDGRSVYGYTINRDGDIERVNKVGGDNYDVLYSKAEYDAGIMSNHIVIGHTKILEELQYNVGYSAKINTGNRRNFSYHKLRWSSSSDAESVAKVFWFATNNSDVEWDLSAYSTKNETEYAIGTQQKNIHSITFSRIASRFSDDKQLISLHNHPKGNLLGASGYKTGLGDFKHLMDTPNAKHYIYDLSTKSVFKYTSSSNHLNPSSVKDYKSILNLIE